MLGEYAEKIDNVDELLSTFLETFAEDPFMVCPMFIRHQHCADAHGFWQTGSATDTHSGRQDVPEEAR